MDKKRFIRAVVGFMSLCFFIAIINIVDYALIYAIFIYLQTLAAPFMVAVDYFFYVFRLSMPYIFMYILISIFFNLQLYKRNATIRIFRYTIDINTVKRSKIYIYARQYNYILIIALNLFLLFIVYYAYINHKYFYLFFVFLFYLLIWIVIKIKHFLFKNEKLQYKKVHMLVNLILVVLVGTYISMTLEDLNISNVKLYGFENFWKLIDNKYFIKMPSKDFNWNRVFNWSKQTSTDRYMFALKKGLMKTELLDEPQEINIDSKLDLASNITYKEKALLPYKDLQNNDININQNVNIADYLYKMQNDDYNMGKFSNAIYQKFKKVFLIQLQMKSTNFMPTPEMNERQKLFNWLHNPSNFIDLSKFYMSIESTESTEYNAYLDLIDKKFNNFTSKKVFLITLHKNYFNLKSFVFFADFENSFKKNYAIFLNSEKYNIDLKNNSILNFEYYNSDLYLNFDFNDLWQNFQKELYIIFKDNKIALSLFIRKFKPLYYIKSFKFSFKEDVLPESDSDYMLEIKPKKSIGIPDFKKLQVWKTFKLNYKEIIYNYTKELRAHKNFKLNNKWLEEDKWLKDNKLIIPKEPFNEIFFWVEEDIIYSLTDYIKLKQVDDLVFNTPIQEYDEALFEHVSYYLENIKSSAKTLNLKSTKKFTTILINDVDKIIEEFQHTRVHVPKFSSMYHEIIYQNSNETFKSILENYEFSRDLRDLLTSSRSFMTFDMWNALMHKLLNLKMNSMYLKNMADFTDFCKSDFTDDLEFNFSLAFNIMQHKNDLIKFQIIPDLEGIPGTFYEYTVKYNQHMDRYYWYEEQEAIIDWFYEISYYSLVNIMDSVKVVDGKENDFLYDMINMYLREPKYKWVAELYESRGMEKNSKQWIYLNKKMNLLNDLEDIIKKKELILSKDKINYTLIDKTNIINFDDINNLQQLNDKLGKDLNIIKTIFDRKMVDEEYIFPEIVDDLATIHHADMHTSEFELILQYYTEARDAQNYEQGELAGIGLQLNHDIKKIIPGISFEAIDNYVEIQNLKRLEFFIEEMDSVMYAEYNNLLEEEQFDIELDDINTILVKKYNYFLISYKEALLKAKFNIVNQMINNLDLKDNIAINNDKVVCKVDKIIVEYEKLQCLESRKAQLAKLPIYNWYTYSYIDENMDILMEEDKDLLLKKLDALNKQLELEEYKLKEMKKVNKLYGKRIMKNYIKNPKNPVTKQFIDKDWDDYNYLSNKSDKFMKDWYKAGKKK